MNIKENLSLRLVIIILFFVAGISSGFLYKISKPIPKYKVKKIKENDASYLESTKLSVNSSNFSNFQMPIFNKEGVRSSLVTARSITWEQNLPIKLSNTVIYEFDVDGKTIITRIRGDFGEITINPEDKSLINIKVWGNTKIETISKE